MNYTKNYQLPQWVESDRIQMQDFNQMCADIDEGMAANKATADAAYSPSQKPYVVGSYTGTGAEMTITLGFRPSFLIISGGEQTTAASSSQGEHDLFTAGNAASTAITFTDTGFTLPKLGNTARPAMVESGKTYDYIAFK